MNKLILLLYLVALSANAQEIIAKLNKEVFDDVDRIGSSYTQYDIDSNEQGFELQFRYNNTVLVNSFSEENVNNNYVLEADRNVPLPFYKSILSKNKKIYLFFDGYKTAQAKVTDLKGNVENSKFFEINVKKKRLLSIFEYKNKFYFLYNPRKTEILNFQIIDEDLNFIEHDIDLLKSNYQHLNKQSDSKVEDKIIQRTRAFIFSDLTLTALKTNQPNSIESITQNKKLYVTQNGISITYENDSFSLSIIDVDLSTFDSTIKRIDKPELPDIDTKKTISNSYILNNHVFIIKGNKKKCLFSIYDLKSHEYVFNHFIEPTNMLFQAEDLLVDKEIWSKFNLKIPQNSKDFTVKKRLKNIMDDSNDIGLQVFDTGELFYIKLGSHKLVPSNISPFDIKSQSLKHFANINFTVENSLNFYLKKSDYSLTYNYKKPVSVKINEFIDQEFGKNFKTKTSWAIQFKHKDDFYLGYVHDKERVYYLRKFN